MRYLLKLENEIYRSRSVLFHWDLCTAMDLTRRQRHQGESTSDVSAFVFQEPAASKPPRYSYGLHTFVTVWDSADSESTAFMFSIGEVLDV